MDKTTIIFIITIVISILHLFTFLYLIRKVKSGGDITLKDVANGLCGGVRKVAEFLGIKGIDDIKDALQTICAKKEKTEPPEEKDQ